MSTTLSEVFNHVITTLESVTGLETKGGSEARKGLCPAHTDDKPSLSVRADSESSKIYIRCFAGCEFEDVIRELGLTPADLRVSSKSGTTSVKSPARVNGAKRPDTGLGKELERYAYTDESGVPLYYNIRFEPKDFRLANSRGEVKSLPKNQTWVPYNLPAVLAAIERGETIWWVEGEKDVKSLADRGVAATTSAGGGNRPVDDNWSLWFAGANVVVVADRDKTGRTYARAVARMLVNKARRVRIVTPATPQPKSDITDHLEAGYDLSDVEELPMRSIRRTRWTLSDIMATKPVPLKWVLNGIIPEGLTLLVGAPKAGKSWLNIDIMIALASGRPDEVFGWGGTITPSPSLYLALEDPHRRLHDRLHQVKSNLDVPVKSNAEVWLTIDPLAAGGRDEIERYLEANPACGCLMVDVLAKVRGTQDVSGGMYQADYEAVGALKDIADDYGVSVIVTHHDRKKSDEDYINTVSGTKGITGAADTILFLKRDRGTDTGVLLVESRDVEEAAYDLQFVREFGRWQIMGKREGGVSGVKEETLESRIVATLLARGSSKAQELAQHLDIDAPSIIRECRKAEAKGKLKKVGPVWMVAEL